MQPACAVPDELSSCEQGFLKLLSAKKDKNRQIRLTSFIEQPLEEQNRRYFRVFVSPIKFWPSNFYMEEY